MNALKNQKIGSYKNSTQINIINNYYSQSPQKNAENSPKLDAINNCSLPKIVKAFFKIVLQEITKEAVKLVSQVLLSH